MNLLFLSHHHSLFGANRSLLTLIDGLRKKENVTMHVIVSGEGGFSSELAQRGVPCFVVPFEYNTHAADAAEDPARIQAKSAALRPMLEIVARTRPNLIYSNSSVIYYGAWLAKMTRKPHVWHLREYGELDYGILPDLGRDFFHARLAESAFTIAISNSIAQHHLASVDARRKRVIYNGVASLEEFASAPRELVAGRPLRLGIVGLIQPAKGQEQAVVAMHHLRGKFPDAVLQIAGMGDGRHLARLKELIREHRLEKNVSSPGVVAEPLAWMRDNVDILLMCSQHEAFGRVTAEAMSQGIPVVGTATGGTPEIITNGRNGLLYDGTPEDLAAKIVQIAASPARYRQMSGHALEEARKRFNNERYVAEVYEVLESVLAARGQEMPQSSPAIVSEPVAAVPALAPAPAKPDPFLNPPLTPENCDLYWVRTSIHRAVRQAMPFFHGTMLDVGCGVMPYRRMITQAPSRVTRYIGLDIETQIYNAAVDLRWDGRRIPLPDASVDCAMATEVLEHCPEPLVVLKEIRRVLKPGGFFFFTVPYVWPLHDAPYDFFRYTPFALEKLLAEAGLEHGNIQALGGWNASLAQMLGLWLKRAPLSREMRENMTKQLYPFYQELVESDELPADPKAGNTMVTGWSGMAFAPRPAAPPEVRQSDLPVVIVRCHESKYSETFIEDHVALVSSQGTLLHGHPFPRFLRGGRSVLPEGFENRVRSARGGAAAAELWRDYVSGIAGFLKASGARVVLVETGLMGAFVFQACEQAGLPYVVHFHGVDATGHDLLKQWGKHYERFFQTAAALVVVSAAMRDQLIRLGAPAERVVLAPYGVSVELPQLANPAAAAPRFLAVGRFVEKKGPQKTLMAFAAVHDQVPDARLVMVGDGPLLASCRQWVVEQGLTDAVTFAGVQSREAVSQLMASSRAFVQHSLVAADGDSEGLPLAVLESGAHGLPVVSTHHAGIPDAVTDGVHGYLVPEGDVRAMAERMLLLATDAALAGRLGAAFRERVRAEFSRQVSIERLQGILAEAAARRPVLEAVLS
jgi:glycosyltransferase involved in cell wall biosynthesis